MHTHAHAHTHTHTRARTHTHTHTHTQVPPHPAFAGKPRGMGLFMPAEGGVTEELLFSGPHVAYKNIKDIADWQLDYAIWDVNRSPHMHTHILSRTHSNAHAHTHTHTHTHTRARAHTGWTRGKTSCGSRRHGRSCVFYSGPSTTTRILLTN